MVVQVTILFMEIGLPMILQVQLTDLDTTMSLILVTGVMIFLMVEMVMISSLETVVMIL